MSSAVRVLSWATFVFAVCGLICLAGLRDELALFAFLLIGLMALLTALVWRCTVGGSFLAGWFALFALPLIPGLHATNRTQLAILLFVVVLAAVGVGRSAGRVPRLTWVAFAVPTALSVLTVGIIAFDDTRLVNGVESAAVLSLGVFTGQVSKPADRRTIYLGITAMAEVVAVLSFVEVARGAPVLQYTTFQVSTNIGSAFRATGLLPHPLILSTFLAAVAAMNLNRQAGRYPWFARSRFIVVAMCVIGCVASGSRSALIILGVVVIAALVARRPFGATSTRKGSTVVIVSVVAATVGLFVSSGNSSLAQRLQSLSTTEQVVRVSGPTVVRKITTGHEILFGNGIRAVTQARLDGDPLAIYATVDNQFLDSYADYGALGVLGLVILTIAVLLGLRRRLLDGWQRAMVTAGVVPLVAMTFFDSLYWSLPSLLFGLAVGSAFPLRTGPRDAEVRGRNHARIALLNRR